MIKDQYQEGFTDLAVDQMEYMKNQFRRSKCKDLRTKGRQRTGDIVRRNREDYEKCYSESASDKGRYPYQI